MPFSPLRLPILFPSILLALVALVPAAEAATITFEPSYAEIMCEEQIAIDVVVDGVSDLRGFSLEIEFAPTVLDLVSVTAGPDLVGAACPHFFHVFPYGGSSSVMFDGSGLGCSVSGPARVATLTFEGATDGIALIDCRSVILRNSLNLPITSTCTDGSVLVSCPVPTAGLRWGTLKARW